MECAAVQKDCDSDTDTVVCLLSDDEDDREKIKIWSRKNGIQRSPPRWATNDEKVNGGARRFSSEVIYVRDSDSESGSESDCVILDTASPGKTSVASRLPADFFDRETPPLSPRRIASIPRHPDNRSLAENDRDKSVKVRDAIVKLARIDELLLDEFAASSGNEHGVLEPISCKSVSETKQTSSVDNLVKHYSAPSINTTTERRLVPTERSPGKGNNICKNSSHRVKSFSPDKSKKIRITLDIPYSKVLQFKNSRQSEFRSVTSSEDFHKTSKTQISQERKNRSLSKSQLSSKDVEENPDVEVDLTKGDKQAESDSCNHRKRKKSKSHSRHENKYRCEICWLRVSNVTDHIVTQHTHLFT